MSFFSLKLKHHRATELSEFYREVNIKFEKTNQNILFVVGWICSRSTQDIESLGGLKSKNRDEGIDYFIFYYFQIEISGEKTSKGQSSFFLHSEVSWVKAFSSMESLFLLCSSHRSCIFTYSYLFLVLLFFFPN